MQVFLLILIAKTLIIIVSLRLNKTMGGWQKLLSFLKIFNEFLSLVLLFR